MKDTPILSELYVSPQGEGIRIGRPSIIARFERCNLSCSWCDTPSLPPIFTFDDLCELVMKNKRYDLILTGGEPTLYQDELIDIIRKSRKNGYNEKITIETNGMIFPKVELVEMTRLHNVLWSISPKLWSSKQGCRTDVISRFLNLSQLQFTIQLKFVIVDDYDLECLQKILKNFDRVNVPVILQPVSNQEDTLESYSMKLKYLVEKSSILSTEYNTIRVLPQLHKIIWGFKSQQI